MSSVLICTNHMANFGGSEIVALEVAECFKKNNYIVDIVSNYIGNPVLETVKEAGINLLTTDELPDPFNYDIVWSQHQVLPILVNEYINNFNTNTYFIFTHLSPYEYMESLGLYAERLFADKIFANSIETFNQLCHLGLPRDISEILFNAAPSEFFKDKFKAQFTLQKILLVSNHPPQEILDAMEILKNEYEIDVIHIGARGDIKRVTPELIQNVDAVVTIGKTVQYAIAGATPVYCYDHFGGIGWLSIDNYSKAETFNYSGRCCRRVISAQEIVNEIISGFSKAEKDVHNIKNQTSKKYCLDFYINNIIKASKQERIFKPLSSEDKQKIMCESQIVKSIKQYYNGYNNLLSEHKDFQARFNDLSIKINNLIEHNNYLISENNITSSKYNELLFNNNTLTELNADLVSEKIKLLENYNLLLLNKDQLLNDFNQLSFSYDKLQNKYLKYKNTFVKRLARKIKSLYNKKVDF